MDAVSNDAVSNPLDAFLADLGYAPGSAREGLARRLAEEARAEGVPASRSYVEARLTGWLREALTEGESHEGVPVAAARLALVRVGLASRWPHVLFASRPPPAFVREVRAALPRVLPPERPCAMSAQELVLLPWLETVRRWWRALVAEHAELSDTP